MLDDHCRSAGPVDADPAAQPSARAGAAPARVQVLGAFTLHTAGAPRALPVDARRLLAHLAVHPREHGRAAVAADLWPGLTGRAGEQLLTEAVAAIDVPGLVIDTADGIAMAAAVQVDLADAMGLIRALPDIPALDRPDIGLLSADLLPGWTAPWIAVERERFRQLRLHALEERSRRSSAAGQHADAVATAGVAVAAAPSRSSARLALVEAHLAAGDVAAAIGQQDEFEQLLRSSLGGPGPQGWDRMVPPPPGWPVLRVRRPAPRAATLPGRRRPASTRRLVAGGTAR